MHFVVNVAEIEIAKILVVIIFLNCNCCQVSQTALKPKMAHYYDDAWNYWKPNCIFNRCNIYYLTFVFSSFNLINSLVVTHIKRAIHRNRYLIESFTVAGVIAGPLTPGSCYATNQSLVVLPYRVNNMYCRKFFFLLGTVHASDYWHVFFGRHMNAF